MEVSAEAKRVMVVALGKLYSSRSQRGGLRLHRSLLLTLVMRSARDIYHAAQATAESVAPGREQHVTAEAPTGPAERQDPALLATGKPRTLPREEVAGSPAANKENVFPGGPHSRKRRGKAAVEPDFLPCKRAKLEQGTCPQQLSVNAVLLEYVNCGGELGETPNPVPLPRAIAAC